MKTLTIRGLPDELHAKLKARAKANRRSLNQEVIAELICTADDPGAADDRKREVLEKVAQFRALLPKTLTSEQIDEAIREGRK